MKLDKLIPVRSAFHKVVNYFLGFLIGLFVLILIFFGFTQTATFREFARKQVLVILNDSINGKINFEQLDGSIFTTLIVRNATLISQGDTILSIGKVGVRLNPLRIFVKTIFVKELIIENVHANLYADSAGQYNISKVFPSSSDTSSSEFPFTITLEKGILTNINAVLCSGIRKAEKAPVPVLDMDNLRIENLNLELSAKANITKKEFLVSLFTATAKTNIQDFNINNFAAKISIKRDEIEIKDMALKTDKSDLYFSSMIKGFHLFGDSLSTDMHTADMNLSLRAFPFHFADLQSLIGVTDYLKGPLQGEIVASGTLDHLLIPKLDLSIGNSKLLVTGKLQKILDGSTMRIDAGITNSVLHREDVLSLLPIVSIPEFENYTTLQIDSLTYSGTPLTFETKMKIAANSGVIRGTVGFDFAKENTTYAIDLRGADVNLAPFIHHPAVFNGGVTVHGENFSPEKVDAAFTIDGAYSIIGRQIYNKLGLTGTLRAGIVDVDLLMKTEKDSVSGNLSASLFPDSLPTYTLSITGKHLNLSEVLMDSSLTSDLNFQFSIDGKSFTPDKIQGDAFLRIEKGFIGINDLDNVEARLSVAHKKDGTVFVSLTSDIIDAEISGTYKINGLLSVLQKEIKNVNRSVTDKLSGYFPELRKDIEAFLSQKTVLTKKVDSVYSGNIDSKFNIKIKDLSKLSGFIKGKEISFDGTIEGILKSNLESFVFEVTSEIGFFKYLDTASSMFIRDAAFKISVSHPYNDYRFGSIKNSVAFEADQAFLNADIKKVFISAALDSSRMKIVLRSEYGEKVNMQMNGTAFFNDDSLLLQLGTIKFKYNLFEVFNKLPSTITYTNGKFSIARLALWRGDAKLALDGTFSFKDSINLMFSSKNLKGYDLSFSILDTKADEVIDNDINIDAKITGTMVNPKIDVTLAVDSITYKKTTYGSYIGTLNYADKKLLVDLKLVEMTNKIVENRLTLKGYIPIDLSFSTVKTRLLADDPVHLQLFADRFNITSLGELIPYISEVKGYVNSEITIDGTLNTPVRKGYLKLIEGTCLMDMNNLQYNAAMEIELNNKEIVITKMEFSNYGSVKQKGVLRGTGKIDLTDFTDPSILISVNGDISVLSAKRKPVSLSLYGDAYVATDGDVIFSMAHGKAFLKMHLIIKEASITFPPTQTTYAGAADNFYYYFPDDKSMLTSREAEIQKLLTVYNERLKQTGQGKNGGYDFDYDISINIKKEAHFVFIFAQEANQKLNAYLNGDIQFERRNGIQNSQGELKVLEGSTLDFIKTFTATGSLRFESDVTNPYLDIVGVYSSYYTESDTSRGDTKEEEVAVKVKLRGPVKDMARSFSKTENNIAVYYGKSNIEKGNVSTEYDNVDAIWFVLLGKFKKDITAQDRTKAASQIDPFTGTATSVASSLIGGFLNTYLGDMVRSVEVRNSGTATKFNLSGRYKDVKYTFGGSTNFLQDLSSASIRVEYSLIDNLIVRVERREATSNVNFSNEMINELGLRYRFEF